MRLLLSLALLVIFQALESLSDSAVWHNFFGDLSTVYDGHKTHYSTTNVMRCAHLAAVKSSCVFCMTETSCVVVTAEPDHVGNSGSAALCYKNRNHCCPPFMNVPGVGCILVIADNYVDFYTAKASCPATSRLWYPKNDTHAENMRKYLIEDRFNVTSDICGPTVPLPNGQPGPCDPQRNHCCDGSGQCVTDAACDCPGCVNYKTAKFIWLDLEKVSGQWTYGDGRVEAAADKSGDFPWDYLRPSTFSGHDFGYMFYSPSAPCLYHYKNFRSTSLRAYICDIKDGQ